MAESMLKEISSGRVNEVELDEQGIVDPSVPVKYRGTVTDKRDMQTLGKVQVLRVSDNLSYVVCDEFILSLCQA
jgi:hypothetical protein